MLIECNAAQQTLIFLMGMLVGGVLVKIFATFMQFGDEAQNKLIHKTRESDHENRD